MPVHGNPPLYGIFRSHRIVVDVIAVGLKNGCFWTFVERKFALDEANIAIPARPHRPK
jgi:hypothetical protein